MATAPQFFPEDLAPGDGKSLALDRSHFRMECVRDVGAAEFRTAYGALWEEFGAAHEIENEGVIARRLAWKMEERPGGWAMRYEMIALFAGETLAAVRDHTAMTREGQALVHLSHSLVMPAWRRTGLAGWLRALPVDAARRLCADCGLSDKTPVTLVAEMEHLTEATAFRLKAYGKAGFKKVNPTVVPYHQPDFRPPEIIDETGGPKPLPFALLLRNVGHETGQTITALSLRELVGALYTMYEREFRAPDMAQCWDWLERFPETGTVQLVEPA